jgi:hypothetical protein
VRPFRKRRTSMMKTVAVVLALTGLGFASAGSAGADEVDKKTVITFTLPVEIPGRVLPAGTYVFKLADSMTDRHIVQVFTADESQILATLMAIPDYRLTSTEQTVIKFGEVVSGAPEAIRAWFYPGNSIGQEFVYPKSRAMQLATAAKTVVPAVVVDVADVDALKTAPIVAITPEAKEVPIAVAIQTTPHETIATVSTVPNSSSSAVGTTGVMQTGRSARQDARQLPGTASALPLIVVFGLGSIGIAFGLMAFGKRAPASVLKP